MRVVFFWIVGLVGVLLIFYLSWVPQPKLGLNWFIPAWVANWTDVESHANIRTGVPFFFLGILAGTWLLGKDYSWFNWFLVWNGLTLVVILAEMGQLFLPYRSFDAGDIGWGAFGALLGLVVVKISIFIKFYLKALIRSRKEANDF